MLFGAYTGPRPAELCGLRVRHVDFLKRSVEVKETLTVVDGRLVEGPTKTYARRSVPLPPFLCDQVADYLAKRTGTRGGVLDPAERLFLGPSGGPLRRTYLHTVVRRGADEAGLPSQLRVHDLRHTCASLLIAGGIHPKAMQGRLGHSTITVTLDTYGHLFPSLARGHTALGGAVPREHALADGSARSQDGHPRSRVLAGHAEDTRTRERHKIMATLGRRRRRSGRQKRSSAGVEAQGQDFHPARTEGSIPSTSTD